MVCMTSAFDPAQHPRAATGEFTAKRNSAPAGGLTPEPQGGPDAPIPLPAESQEYVEPDPEELAIAYADAWMS